MCCRKYVSGASHAGVRFVTRGREVGREKEKERQREKKEEREREVWLSVEERKLLGSRGRERRQRHGRKLETGEPSEETGKVRRKYRVKSCIKGNKRERGKKKREERERQNRCKAEERSKKKGELSEMWRK